MTVVTDPDGISAATLLEFTNFNGKQVFEIGCGEGRITWVMPTMPTRSPQLIPLQKTS
ncbi:unnamed protein product [marine sediment metagenome]|uniref:Uncharacterized protein n=1 Tax=marine sediment metagenome TaxID=412755 RepID=X1F025_9ZZZZ